MYKSALRYRLIGIVIKAKSVAMRRETSYALVRSLSRYWILVATLDAFHIPFLLISCKY